MSGTGWVSTLDPAVVTDAVSISDLEMVDAGLVKAVYPGPQFVPDLAAGWTVSQNRRVWTFSLRKGLRFSNGDPLTAWDVKWSLTRALLPATKSPVAPIYLGHVVGAADVAAGKTADLAGVQVLSQRSLRIVLDGPIGWFLAALSYPTSDVLDRRVLGSLPPGANLTDACAWNVGTGPFRLSCRSRTTSRSSFYTPRSGPSMTFTPNPYYHGHRPNLRVYAPFTASTADSYADYLAGLLDGSQVPVADARRARTKPGFLAVPQLVTDYISLNQSSAPFDNQHCRLAVAYAVNRVRITRDALSGTEGPLYGVVPPGLPGFVGKEHDVPAYDPSRAASELARCPGHLQGVTLGYQQSGLRGREYRQVRQDLLRIGAAIRLEPLTFDAWIDTIGQNMSRAREQMVQSLWIGEYPDPQDWCATLLRSGAPYNIGGFHDPRYDALVDEAATAPDPSRRATLYQQAQKRALQEGALVSLGYELGLYVVSPKVHGMTATPDGVWPEHNDWSRVWVAG